MPAETDPDEFVLREGPEAFQQLLSNTSDALTYKWKQLVRRFKASDDLTARQKAVEEYLQVLASARGSGPVDPLRWGQALARVSRLIEIPAEELNRRFRSPKNPPRRPAVSVGSGAGKVETVEAAAAAQPEPPRPLDATGRAERRILGILLLEPARWMRVQRSVHVEDFSVPLHRRLAELYWEHQRHEGEPVFNEFLGQIGDDAALVDLAVEAVDEVEALASAQRDDDEEPGAESVLRDALEHLEQTRRLRESQKLVAALQRKTHERQPQESQNQNNGQGNAAAANDDDEVSLLIEVQNKARQPDLRRVR
jgi:DNA primase